MEPAGRMHLREAVVLGNTAMKGDYRLLELEAPDVAAAAQPGQFVHIHIPGAVHLLLRRPFSIFKAGGGRLSIFFKTVGEGTRRMNDLAPGQKLSVLGPLGHGFPAVSAGKYPVLVGGGYGMAALYLCAERSPVPGVAFFGGRTAEDIFFEEEFRRLGWEVRVATDDGSLGVRGLVTVPLEAWLAHMPPGTVPEFFACGPNAMLRAVGDCALRGNGRAWLSMDRNMGCGVGACLTCVQKILLPDGNWAWQRVCREGPVFEARQIAWEA